MKGLANKISISSQVSGTDLQNVNMIAFRHVNQFEITGSVVTDSKFISSLKVIFFFNSNFESNVYYSCNGIVNCWEVCSEKNCA